MSSTQSSTNPSTVPSNDETNAHRYDAARANAIELRWQNVWEENKTFCSPNPNDAGFDASEYVGKKYILDMFPYPSGAGLHVGHPLGYIATDIYARFLRASQFHVLHSMGFDAFGLPAEQYAVEHGVHPRITTENNIASMKRQLRRLGLGHDPARAFSTTDVDYYRWTQWIFLQVYNAWYDSDQQRARPISELIEGFADGSISTCDDDINPDSTPWAGLKSDTQRQLIDAHRLAYISNVPVNWCPALGTVLANEEVTADGKSERGNHPVYKRPLKQWMMRITEYAERLLNDLDPLAWPEPIKLMQRNWVGRSEGAVVRFAVDKSDATIEVFTTRPDTLFGATYMVLAPEHELVNQITTPSHTEDVARYKRETESRSDIDRMAENRTKTGVFTGAFACNPATGQPVPIWIADYVLMGYGTGAIMAVPAHDDRDYEFAKTFDLPIVDVVHSRLMTLLYEAAVRLKELPSSTTTTIAKSRATILVDFVALCMSQNRDDYDNVWKLVGTQRVDQPPLEVGESLEGVDVDAFFEQKLSEALESGPAGKDRRGSVSAAWSDQVTPLLSDGVDQLIEDAIHYRLAARLGQANTSDGIAVNSDNGEVSLNNLSKEDAIAQIARWLESQNIGSLAINYKLRDWLFSRQRYWGEPFPIVYDDSGNAHALEESDLPVELPPLDNFSPKSSDDPDAVPEPPLARASEWVQFEKNGQSWSRETNTMPQWAGSCWYYLRYLDKNNSEHLVDPAIEKYWMISRKDGQPIGDPAAATFDSSVHHWGGVDLYVGGAEHAVLHLLYARFWHKVLFDLGHVSTPEPFGKLFNQGYIQAFAYTDKRGIAVPADDVVEKDDGKWYFEDEVVNRSYGKMGKSLKNSVTPDEMCDDFGCDTMRLYEMYMGPLEQSKPWSTRDAVGSFRFLQRVWRNFVDENTGESLLTDDHADDSTRRHLHKTIAKVREDMHNLSFNTAIAAMIELNNALVKLDRLPREIAEPMLKMLAPFVPHFAEELWQKIGHNQDGTQSITYESFPEPIEKYLVDDEIQLIVQILGKVRAKLMVPAGCDEESAKNAALTDDNVQRHLEGKTIRKVIYVPGRLINFVAN